MKEHLFLFNQISCYYFFSSVWILHNLTCKTIEFSHEIWAKFRVLEGEDVPCRQWLPCQVLHLSYKQCEVSIVKDVWILQSKAGSFHISRDTFSFPSCKPIGSILFWDGKWSQTTKGNLATTSSCLQQWLQRWNTFVLHFFKALGQTIGEKHSWQK